MRVKAKAKAIRCRRDSSKFECVFITFSRAVEKIVVIENEYDPNSTINE